MEAKPKRTSSRANKNIQSSDIETKDELKTSNIENNVKDTNTQEIDNREIIKLLRTKDCRREISISKAYNSDTGFDLQANLKLDMILGQRAKIGTGLILEFPNSLDVQIRPKSGLAFKNGQTVINAPGKIDTGYQGEVILINWEGSEVSIYPGMKIAQLTFNYKALVKFQEINSIKDLSERKHKGLGSSDKEREEIDTTNMGK
jgi:dUTP pyrophosphatase